MANGERVIEREGRLEVLRRAELKRVCRALQQHEYVVVSASPQSGISTFIRQAYRAITQDRAFSGYASAVVPRLQLRHSFFVAIGEQIAQALRGPVRRPLDRVRRLSKLENEKGFTTALKAAFGRRRPAAVVLLIDDFHLLDLSEQRRFLAGARRLHQQTVRAIDIPRILIVLAGAFDWDLLDPDRLSPFANVATRVPLPDLTEGEISELALRLFRRRGMVVDAVEISTIYQYTSGHPHLTQRICEVLLEQGAGNGPVTAVAEAAAALAREGDSHLAWLRTALIDLSEQELRPLTRVLNGHRVRRSILLPDRGLERLITLGVLVEESGGRVRLRNRLYSMFIREDEVLHTTAFRRSTIVPYAALCHASSAANAAAYAIVHRLENELRSLVVTTLHREHGALWMVRGLNGVRIATQQHRGEVVNELSRALEVRREIEAVEFDEHDGESCLAYANLKELEQVIVKSWSLFKGTIGTPEALRSNLTALNRIRNRLAHNRIISQRQLRWLKTVESSIRRWSPYGDEGPL